MPITRHTMSPFDFQMYPHILSTIVDHAPFGALLALRSASCTFADLVDARLFKHVLMDVPPSGVGVELRSPDMPFWRLPYLPLGPTRPASTVPEVIDIPRNACESSNKPSKPGSRGAKSRHRRRDTDGLARAALHTRMLKHTQIVDLRGLSSEPDYHALGSALKNVTSVRRWTVPAGPSYLPIPAHGRHDRAPPSVTSAASPSNAGLARIPECATVTYHDYIDFATSTVCPFWYFAVRTPSGAQRVLHVRYSPAGPYPYLWIDLPFVLEGQELAVVLEPQDLPLHPASLSDSDGPGPPANSELGSGVLGRARPSSSASETLCDACSSLIANRVAVYAPQHVHGHAAISDIHLHSCSLITSLVPVHSPELELRTSAQSGCDHPAFRPLAEWRKRNTQPAFWPDAHALE